MSFADLMLTSEAPVDVAHDSDADVDVGPSSL
jgi:hypothetical protein